MGEGNEENQGDAGETDAQMLTRTIGDGIVRLEVAEIHPGDVIIAYFPQNWPPDVIQSWLEMWWDLTGIPNGVMVMHGEVRIEVKRAVEDSPESDGQ
jgi:hypothetical protein